MLELLKNNSVQTTQIEKVRTILEYKFNEYLLKYKNNKPINDYYEIPFVTELVFEKDSIPKSKTNTIYQVIRKNRQLFINLGSKIFIYKLAINETSYIKLNLASIALLYLLYNEEFRKYCEVQQNTKQILHLIKHLIFDLNYDNNPF